MLSSRTMERKSQLKTIKVRLFSVRFHLLLFLYRRWFWRRGTVAPHGKRKRRLLDSHEALQRTERRRAIHPATCDLLCGVTARGTESRTHNSGLLTDTTQRFSHCGGSQQTGAPTVMKYWSLFLTDYLLLHSHLLDSVSLFSFSFYNCVFPVRLWHDFLPPDLYRFSSVAFLFWCGLDCACFVFQVMSSVSPSLSLSPVPVSPHFWSDGVCV